MKIVKYQIKVPYTKNNTETEYTATLTSYTLDIFNETGRRKSPAVIISPGGGYYKVAEKENSEVVMLCAKVESELGELDDEDKELFLEDLEVIK